jgi:hypothetical protein
MAQTLVVITTSGQEFPLPGTAWTAATVVQSFASSVPGIASMQAEETMNGENKVITFRPKTGTKGNFTRSCRVSRNARK